MNGEKQSLSAGDKNNNGKKSHCLFSNCVAHHDILKWVIIILGGLAIAVLIFSSGMVVGGMKARFSYRWAENYHQNFAGPKGGFIGNWQKAPAMPGDFMESHGIFGEIIETKDNGFVIKGPNNIETVVNASSDTVVNKGGRADASQNELKVGDRVVIIGTPNEQGQIEAKLIRLFNRELNDVSVPPNRFNTPFF